MVYLIYVSGNERYQHADKMADTSENWGSIQKRWVPTYVHIYVQITSVTGLARKSTENIITIERIRNSMKFWTSLIGSTAESRRAGAAGAKERLLTASWRQFQFYKSSCNFHSFLLIYIL